MAIVMVNGGGNTPQGDVTDGTSNTLMFGESSSAAHGASTDGQPTNWPMLLRMEHELAADNALSFDAYDASAGTSLPRTVVDGTSNTLTFGEPYVPTGHECLVFFLGGEDLPAMPGYSAA